MLAVFALRRWRAWRGEFAKTPDAEAVDPPPAGAAHDGGVALPDAHL